LPERFSMEKTTEHAKHFQLWIDTFGEDIRTIVELLDEDDAHEDLKRLGIGTLNYGLKQLDLIPDFYEPVGLIDDCMIIRVFASLALEYVIQLKDDRIKKRLVMMAEQNEVVIEFSGKEIYRALMNYVKVLPDRKVRHRDAKIILTNEDKMKDFKEDIAVEMKGYVGAKIDDPEGVCKDLKSFLKLKLVG
jgi:uncharacterized membrane protein YkvA (DUF1232 family)